MNAREILEEMNRKNGKAAPPPPAARPKAVRTNGEAGLFELASAVDTVALLDRLGIDHDEKHATCPGCSEAGALICRDGGLKCLHDRCANVGPGKFPGFRNPVGIVEAARTLTPKEAALWICGEFNIPVPERKTNGSSGTAEPPPDPYAGAPDVPPSEEGETPGPEKDAWETPVPFDDIGTLPEFPVEILPAVVRDFVVATAEATQTPVSMTAALALASLSAIVSKKYEVEVRPGWREPLCAFWVVVAKAGERKSPVFRAVTAPIQAWEAQQAKVAAPKIQAALTRLAILDKAHKAAVSKAATSGFGTDGQRAEELAVELGELRVPVAPRITADDTTSEKLALLLEQHGGRMAIMSAEGGAFATMGGRYSDGVPNVDIFLKGHAADEMRVDRINRAPVHVRRPTLTMGLAVQPAIIAGLAEKPIFRGCGLLARCLFALPESKVGSRKITPAPVPDAVAAGWHDLCTRLLDAPEKLDENGEIVSTVLRYSPEGVAALEGLARDLEPRLGPGGDLEHAADWANKLVGACARILAVLHLARGAGSSQGTQGVLSNDPDDEFGQFQTLGVSSQSSQSSQRDMCHGNPKEILSLSLFLLAHALAAFRMMGADPVFTQARTVLNHLRTLTTLRTTKSAVQQALRSTFPKADNLDEPLRTLTEHGYIRLVEQTSTSKGGRKPSPVIEVNPAVAPARRGTAPVTPEAVPEPAAEAAPAGGWTFP